MDRISGLSDELLARILTFVPTKVAVSTSILSKRWEFLWTWVPKLEFVDNKYGSDLAIRDFINKNLPLLKPPVIESFLLKCYSSFFQPEDITQWVATTVSRCIVELDIDCVYCWSGEPCLLLPCSLFTCESLVTLKLNGEMILLDVPRTVYLPSLKTLHLGCVTYSKEDTFRLLLSYCPVLEDLVIQRSGRDKAKAIVVISPSLHMLTLPLDGGTSSTDEFVIVTPSLKYLNIEDYNARYSYLVAHMPKVEEADIVVDEYLEMVFESITSVKRLSLCVYFDFEERYMYHDGIFFGQLEHLKLGISFDYWSKLLFRLRRDAPKLRVLKLYVYSGGRFKKYESISWNNDPSAVPTCLLESLETFEFADYRGRQEERDFVSFIIKHACHLKSSTITPSTIMETCSSADSCCI
ncbi:unnamed protein product [Brassica oleracea var. botrytis]|uniref:Uncharacterized protein n=1 Tax=Brassica oleracea var. oleracea TaxID=109376 RepID=A0A0D2ZUD0_BRAOL|nr:PREDICTED: FBD-associated F-box protein At2g26860-like isoform X1 [Brassica oleracea var. oleracea]